MIYIAAGTCICQCLTLLGVKAICRLGSLAFSMTTPVPPPTTAKFTCGNKALVWIPEIIVTGKGQGNAQRFYLCQQKPCMLSCNATCS